MERTFVSRVISRPDLPSAGLMAAGFHRLEDEGFQEFDRIGVTVTVKKLDPDYALTLRELTAAWKGGEENMDEIQRLTSIAVSALGPEGMPAMLLDAGWSCEPIEGSEDGYRWQPEGGWVR